MEQEMRIELHAITCSCRGGAWVLMGGGSGSPCPGATRKPTENVILGVSEWRTLGKPGTVEAYAAGSARVAAGERREFHRYQVTLRVRLARITTWRDPSSQYEDTVTDVIAKGGALVRSRMAVGEGEVLSFEVGTGYKTRAEVVFVSTEKEGGEGTQLLGLRFLDAPLPDTFIPPDAKPLP